MNLLFDQNLSHWLCPALGDRFPGALHIREIGLREASDSIIWDYAAQHGFAIVTKDGDFRQRPSGDPPQISLF